MFSVLFQPPFEVPCIRLSTGKCLIFDDTTSRGWLQITLLLLVSFCFPLFSMIFSSFSPDIFPYCENTQAVEQDAQRNCTISVLGGFQDQTGVT